MTSSSLFQHRRRWAIAAALVATVSQGASAQVTRATAIRDTIATYTGGWRNELPAMFARIGSVLDSGCASPEQDLVWRERGGIRPRGRPDNDGPHPYKYYSLQVQFRGRTNTLNIFAYWPDTGRVSFRVRSPDTLLIGAIDSSFRGARAVLLSPARRMRLWVNSSYGSEGAFREFHLGLEATDAAKHCPRFGLET